MTEHVNRFVGYSTHELGIQPEAYEMKLDVDVAPLCEQYAAAAGIGKAALRLLTEWIEGGVSRVTISRARCHGGRLSPGIR
ncbi:hypothetical protein, partial [Streptomyces milbemycinicus]|uniref:hypothetical protein n=1 Tax=Streptomyces milbemycinicus TaxID=476552 RepID=UPI0033FCC427